MNIRLDIVDLTIYAISNGGNTLNNAEKSNEFNRACAFRELVNAWHKKNAPDTFSEDPAIVANHLLKLYKLTYNSQSYQYEIELKELV